MDGGLFSNEESQAANEAAGITAGSASRAGGVLQQYLQDALNMQRQQYNAGVSALNNGYSNAQGYLQPYSMGGYNAYDTLMSGLGLQTPNMGSFALSQMLKQGGVDANELQQDQKYNPQDVTNQEENLLRQRFGNNMLPWGDTSGQSAVGGNFANMSPQQIDQLYRTTIQNAQNMVNTNTTMDNVGFKRGQGGVLQNWINQANQANIGSYQDAYNAQQQAQQIQNDPTYQNYLNYQKTGQVPGGMSANPQNAIGQFQASPGYQFALNTGQNLVTNNAAAKGLLNSTNFANNLTQYGQGVANQEYQRWLGNLAGVAGMGAQASGNLANLGVQQGQNLADFGTNFANRMSNIYSDMGSNIANSLLAQGNAWAGGKIGAANADASRMQGIMSMAGNLGSQIGPSMFQSLGNTIYGQKGYTGSNGFLQSLFGNSDQDQNLQKGLGTLGTAFMMGGI